MMLPITSPVAEIRPTATSGPRPVRTRVSVPGTGKAIMYNAPGGQVGRVEGLLTRANARRVTHLLLQEERPFRHNEITIATGAVTGVDGGLHHDLGPNQIEDVPPAVG
jgi:hypothetical protein